MGKDSLARRTPDAGALDRRLILIGSYIDSVSQADPVSMARLMKGLDEFLERDQDRALFNLPPRPKDACRQFWGLSWSGSEPMETGRNGTFGPAGQL